MPNNELNSIRIAVKNGETNESNPVNIITGAKNIEVKTDYFQGNILDYIDDLKDNTETRFNEIDNSSNIVYLSDGHMLDSMRSNNIQAATSPKYNDSTDKMEFGYRVSDVLANGVIPTVEESYEKIKTVDNSASQSSDIIKMNRSNFISLIDEKYIKEVFLLSPKAIYNWILNGNDEHGENYIYGTIDFNENIIVGDITDDDVNLIINNIVYGMLPFTAFCDYVKNSATIYTYMSGVSISFKLKMYSSRKYTNKETLEIDCTKFTENESIYSHLHSFMINSGKNICIIVSDPNQEDTTTYYTYMKTSDYCYDNSRMVPLSTFPIILTPWNQYTNFTNDNFIEKYSDDTTNRPDKLSFITELSRNLAIVSAEKDDKTGKYICKISNNERGNYTSFFLSSGNDKSIVCGRYSLWLPKNIKPLVMYMQVNNSTPVKLVMYSSDTNTNAPVHKKRYGKMYCEDTGRVKKLYIGEFKEYLLPDMHIASNGTYNNWVKEYNRSFNKITIYITLMDIEFVPDRVEHNDDHGIDHL